MGHDRGRLGRAWAERKETQHSAIDYNFIMEAEPTGREAALAQAVKWAVTVILAIVVFLLAMWIVLLACGSLTRSWSHSDQVATAVAVATLIGTATLTIGGWWAQRDPEPQAPASIQPQQANIVSVRSSTGVIGNNITNSDVHYD